MTRFVLRSVLLSAYVAGANLLCLPSSGIAEKHFVGVLSEHHFLGRYSERSGFIGVWRPKAEQLCNVLEAAGIGVGLPAPRSMASQTYFTPG